MSYATRELSQAAGAPVELYEFQAGTRYWRYTSDLEAQAYLGFTYAAETIRRGRIEQGGERNNAQLSVDLPADNPLARLFIEAPPMAALTLKIHRFHRGDGGVRTVWAGRVIGCVIRGVAAALTCEPVYTALQRPGLRRHYQTRCPHDLYGSACKVGRAAYKVEEAVGAVSGAVLTMPSADNHSDGYYDGGYVEWSSPDGLAWAFIVAHSGEDLTLARPLPGVYAGATVSYYAGCDRTRLTCFTKFGNIANFGGFPWMPDKNPFRVKIY